jgi:flagellar operon protein (TIGR03826 family)
MGFGKLANCASCDALFLQSTRDVCPKCYQQIEKGYEKCAQFLRKRENRGSTMQQLSEATGVSAKQITRFIREGRISITNMPNLGYPCENCDEPIQKGTLCDNCSRGLQREINQQLDVDQRLADEEKGRNAQGYKRKDHINE